MKYTQNSRRRANIYEKEISKYWKDNAIFEKSIENRPKGNSFVFYDGPPFLTGTPHHGHLLISTVKDAVGRFQTMQGKRVERRWGWDCHGLPAEVFVEKQLGITSKKEIGTKISIEEYVNQCRAAMVKTGTEWEDVIERIGRWVEFEGAYKTMDNEFMESVWWAFKELYDKGKIYEGEKILIYCTKDATPISKSEVAMENSYQKDTDPSVYVYFKLVDREEYLLAWTTTPWTLPANVAIAVNKSLKYSLVEYCGKKFYVASDSLKQVMKDEKHQSLDYNVVKEIDGKSLIGLKYEPLFENRGPNAHIVLDAGFVSSSEGTGIVHEAPAYGEEDYDLCKQHNIPVLSLVDENGNYSEGRWQGENIWQVNKLIAKTLLEEGNALKVEYIVHDYPHCHRCGGKLMYRAHPSWFMDIQGQKKQMLQVNGGTAWVPDVLRTGRFNNIIDQAPDWNLSRDRYWATPIPVWKGQKSDGTDEIKVFGSFKEFEEFTGKKLDDYHLPGVMNQTFELNGVTMHHIGKVLDCWFESGSMPFAQFHYPFENKEKFEKSFPADFIVEAIDQTRGWFYSLTAVNVGLFGKSPFKNLICTGFINAADGKKMSKKLKNYTDPIKLMDQYSADSFRMLMLSSPLTSGENFALSDKDVAGMARKLSMIWNMYDFFTLYADVDNWEWSGQLQDPSISSSNVLDKWIISRVHELSEEVANFTSKYDLANAVKPIFPFIDDASNWFVRRSRKRFWKSENDQDKDYAYKTLHYVLVKLSIILAPFTPFLSEELYRQLTGGESVHLLDWPKPSVLDQNALDNMAQVREAITIGLSDRADNSVKVRQPLAKATINNLFKNSSKIENLDDYLDILKEELNVKEVDIQNGSGKLQVKLDFNITKELKLEGLARELIRNIQNSRKEAGFNVDDRITLKISSKDSLIDDLLDNKELKNMIMQETLTSNLLKSSDDQKLNYQADITVDKLDVKLSMSSLVQ